MELGEPDEKGRRKPVGTGKFETIAVSSVIAAIGQVVDWGTLDVGALETTKKGTAVADSLTYQTAQPDIFVGGDCYTGPKFAIDAIAAGKEASISIHRYVHPGQTLSMGRDRRVYKALDKEHALLDISHFDHGKRQMPGYNEAKAKTFSNDRLTFTEEQIRKEASRCLGCAGRSATSASPSPRSRCARRPHAVSAAVRQRSTSTFASAAVCVPPSASLTRSTSKRCATGMPARSRPCPSRSPRGLSSAQAAWSKTR